VALHTPLHHDWPVAQQCPPEQTSFTAHVTPQPPQLLGSIWASTHLLPLQSVVPPKHWSWQLGAPPSPAGVQKKPFGHLVPH
jgi:hypothetical protein